MENRIKALAKFLELSEEEATEIEVCCEERCELSYGGGEYIVLTDDEANEAARDYIRESLWAFKASWINDYINIDGNLTEFIESMQEKRCESCNEAIYALVKDRFEDLVEDSISADGRGHFIAPYDFEENEEGEYFIYRQ